MTPRQRSKKAKWKPMDYQEYIGHRAPYEVHTGPIITLHFDIAGAEAEVRWQREQYGRVGEIVQPADIGR